MRRNKKEKQTKFSRSESSSEEEVKTPRKSPVRSAAVQKPETPAKSSAPTVTVATIPHVEGDVVFDTTGEFVLWVQENRIVVGDKIELQLIQTSKFEYTVCFYKEDELIHSWPVQATTLRFQEAHLTASWIADMGGPKQISFTFPDSTAFNTFKKKHTTCSFESKTKTAFKATKEDESWLYDGLVDKFSTFRLSESEEEEDDFEEEEAPKPIQFNTPTKNSLLSVGRYSSNSFVVRGDQVGVFSPSKRGTSMKFQTMTDSVKTVKDKTAFAPSHALLHQRDEKLLFLHPTEKKKIFCMDLERGKVVEEWDTEGLSTQKILPETKDAQQKGRDTFLGINNAGFFIMDPRQKTKVVRTYQYKNANTTHFSCAATTDEGHMAVGTKLGDIRLFNANSLQTGGVDYINSTAPRAKTKLLGFGDPILGIDTTRDGSFVLATCYNYLILSPVQEGKATGFSKSVKKAPLLLRLGDADAMKIGASFQFTPAKFNVAGTETFVVTSAKNWIITWDLSEIIKEDFSSIPPNTTLPYYMKQLPDVVVADDFSGQQKTDIIFAMPDDVRHYQWKGGRSKK
eukprot:TRINITY_DN2343_c0_g1_i8.p1 TRINITY_DN2343_c0_g1~~TRINITY_DN2343_c0_g1_i8.p1  ORF type:complete len:569 (+),score=159.72 TRINITY_DN2343_c0_g1_i8:466-2172(+)